jgi:2-C-methyl-D-erythritol 2,4-cyclodiphosphate synthase
MRVGTGYDVHPFAQGRPLVLGGVEIAGADGLSGHSDGDVLLHALCDALLGAAALGDIGLHFPPTDPSYAGADSKDLLRRVRELVAGAGYGIENVDSTIIAERPRLQEHMGQMRRTIAAVLGVDESRVSVKATTQEGLGAIGRGEGIAALAVALLK